MGEINYRAWDGEKFHYLSLVPGGFTPYPPAFAGILVLDWQQDTGLKDKNGKRIWEGDIVQLTLFDGVKDKPEEVKWSVINDGGEAIGFGYWNFTGHEVIGNIYENPELLQS